MRYLKSTNKYKVVLTCEACPEQYKVFDKDGHQVAYIRERHGHLTVECPECGDLLMFEADLTPKKPDVIDFADDIFKAIDKSERYVGHCGFDGEKANKCKYHTGLDGCKCKDEKWSWKCPIEQDNMEDLNRISEIEELEYDSLRQLDEMMKNNYSEEDND